MNQSSPVSLALEIKAEMTRQQVSTEDLAAKCGMSVHQVNRRLAGSVALSVHDAMLISDALGVPLWMLLQRAASCDRAVAA